MDRCENGSVVVSTTSSQILGKNFNRVIGRIQNTSTNEIFISLDSDASLNQGVLLTASGSYGCVYTTPYHYNGSVSAISTTASRVVVVEMTKSSRFEKRY